MEQYPLAVNNCVSSFACNLFSISHRSLLTIRALQILKVFFLSLLLLCAGNSRVDFTTSIVDWHTTIIEW